MRRRINLSVIRNLVPSLLVFVFSPSALGQEVPSPNTQPVPLSAPESSPANIDFSLDQAQLADRFTRLERVMLRLAEMSDSTDPRRAKVLRQAVAQAKSRDIAVRYESVVNLLQKERLGLAEKNQKELRGELQHLLVMLLKENRSERLESDQRRLRKLLKDVNRLIKYQRGVKARTEGGEETDRLADAQAKIADKTGDLRKNIEQNGIPGQENAQQNTQDEQEGIPSKEGDAKQDAPKESGEGEKKSSDQPSGDKQPGEKSDAKSGDKSSKDSSENQKPSESSPSKPADGSEGKSPSESDSSESQPSESKPSQQGQQGEQGQQGQQDQQQQQDSPQQRVKAAEEGMRKAEERLEKAQREGAVEEQKKAIEELEQAKADLERILRQMREEQIERTLAMLEARFRKMLKLQVEVYETTVKLGKIPANQRDYDVEIESSRQSRQESEIVREADKALRLLREDGTSVAFPETVEQLREDMSQVADRLSKTQVGELTQVIEEDIIATLEEIISALQKAQEDLEEQKQQPQQQQQQSDQDQELMQKLAELKMIRSMQIKVNRRTARYAKMIEGEQADQPGILKAINRLSERENSIFEATHYLHLGTNK